jgi:signal transduction histidine kinase
VTAATVVPEADGNRPLSWRRVFGVPFRAATWRSIAYELLALPLGIAYFVILVTGFSVGAGLAVVIVGLAVLALTVVAWRIMAGVERTLARRLLRVTIPAPGHMAPGLSPWQRVKSVLRDPVTWKSLVFVVLKLPLGIISFAVLVALGSVGTILTFAPGIVALTPVTFFGWIMETPAEAIPIVPAGIAILLATFHIADGMGWLSGLFARVMLGPSTVQLRERVDDLRYSRARIIEAADAERRRLERDLHDGAQQRLVALTLTLGLAESRLKKDDAAAAAPLVAQAREEAMLAVQELRELARGIHPAVLSDRGLAAALEALAGRAPIPVTVSGVPEDRLPPPVEAAAYFVVAESLTNVAKYAQASAAQVTLATAPDLVRVAISDDGVGGADPRAGSGIRGLRDRVEALDGSLEVLSPPGRGTTVTAELPVDRR